MTEKQELEALRRQKREWELERANLLAEQGYTQKRIDTLAIERDASDEEVVRLVGIINEMARVTLDGLAKLKEPNAPAEREVLDGPDDVDAERMQGTADHDPESLVGEEAYE